MLGAFCVCRRRVGILQTGVEIVIDWRAGLHNDAPGWRSLFQFFRKWSRAAQRPGAAGRRAQVAAKAF